MVTRASSFPSAAGVNVAVAAAPGGGGDVAVRRRGAQFGLPFDRLHVHLPGVVTMPISTYSKPCGNVFSAGIFWRIQKYRPSFPLVGGSMGKLNALSASVPAPGVGLAVGVHVHQVGRVAVTIEPQPDRAWSMPANSPRMA